MTTRSKSNQFQSRTILLTVFAALVTAGSALPQTAPASGNAAKDTESGYSKIDLGVFFGPQWFQIYQGPNTGANQFFETRPIVGERLTENFSKWVGLEEAFTLGFNRFAVLPYGSTQYATIDSRNTEISVVGIFNLAPRGSKIRPYLLFGPEQSFYSASGGFKYTGTPPIAPLINNFKTESYFGVTYGFGTVVNLNHRFAVQFDVRGVHSQQTADFGQPTYPYGPGSIFITHNHGENAVQYTTGIVFRFGYVEPPAPYVAPPPPARVVEAPKANVQVSAIQGAHDVCPGDNLSLTVTASGWLPDQTPAYQWTVNNQPAPGGTGNTFNLPTTAPGPKAVSVTVSAGGSMASATPVNVLVRALTPPTVQFSVSPTTIAYGDRLPLNAQANVSQCATATPIRYTASEGSIAGTAFDSSTLSFDPNGAGLQQKMVRLTATETDSRNQTANANATVTVNYKRPATRTDIVFPNRSSRVNNAAKRYLIEVLTPMLRADPNSKVILIGHRDMSETGRAAATLDRQRVLNAAAVLSAGKGICPQLDLSRVQVVYAGTDQTDAPMPFADSSVKERGGQSATDQRAQFRRVEVWYIPGGADTPAITGLEAAPVKEIQAKGCPR